MAIDFRLAHLRTRVFLFTVLTTLVLGLASLYSQFNSRVYLDGMTRILERSRPFLALRDRATGIEGLLESYLSTKSYTALKEYWTRSQELYELIRGLDTPLDWTQGSQLRLDMAELLKAYLRSTEDAITAKRGRDAAAYARAFETSDRMLGYIAQLTGEIIQVDYQDSASQGQRFAAQLGTLQLCNTLMIVSLMVLGLLLGFWFSEHLTGPLARLSESARRISEGNYDAPVQPSGRDDEIGLLTAAFETMRAGIVRNIAGLTERAEIENRLMSERLDNLRMKNLLKNAELQALQAQVNPHFLFNTLNTGIQMAILDDAEETRLYMENLAEVFRHNIRRLDKPVTLAEELRSLQSYLYIMRIRFADRFDFRLGVPEPCPDLLMPAMVLQPLVENAITHGLRDREEGGWVAVTAVRQSGALLLEVADNGSGMPEAAMSRCLAAGGPSAAPPADDEVSRKSNGIGLNNVISRMRLFFGDFDLVTIASPPGGGTRISFRINLDKESPDVQDPGSR